MSLFKFGFVSKPSQSGDEPSTSSSFVDKNQTEDEPSASSSAVDERQIEQNDFKSDSVGENPPKRKKESATKTKSSVGRKYNPDYLRYGFYFTEKEGKECPLCVVCEQVLANSCMAPTKLIRHFSTHEEVQEKPREYFQSLKNKLKGQAHAMQTYSKTELAAIEASFVVAYEIAKTKKPFTIAERLIQPCMSKVAEIMLDKAAVARINMVPMSDTTISRRFSDMARDVQSQLHSRLKESRFTLQFDESTDISNEAILIGFVRYTYDFHIVEDIFCFVSLEDNATGEKVFNAIAKKMDKAGLEWKQVVGLCTDGAPAMTGRNVGLAKRMAEVASEEFSSAHCILHREALASKAMSAELNATMHTAVKMINSIKSNPLCSRILSLICSESGSEHDMLLFHADVRWLSRGNTLVRLFELRGELCTFYRRCIEANNSKPKRNRKKGGTEKEPEKMAEEIFLEKMNDSNWLCSLAYLSDIFGHLNGLNLVMQGAHKNYFDLWNKIAAFKKSILIWEKEILKNDFSAFSFTKHILSGNKSTIEYIQPIVLEHLRKLASEFDRYFPPDSDPRTHYSWTVHPFLNVNEPNKLTTIESIELLGNIRNIYELISFTHRSVSVCFILFRTNVRSDDEELLRNH